MAGQSSGPVTAANNPPLISITASELETLGIRLAHDHLGRATYELDILKEDGSTTTRARFDAAHKQWRCRENTPDNSSHKTNDAAQLTITAEFGPNVRRTSIVGDRLGDSATRGITQDWTYQLPDTSHVRFLRATDWASTPLGPMQGWNIDLQVMVYKMLTDPRGACLYWGPDRVAIYNENFSHQLAGLHPKAMGQPYRLMDPASWPVVKPLMEGCDQSKTAVHIPGMELHVERSGFLEEAYFDCGFIPLFSPVRHEVVGIYNSCYDMTRQVLFDRRAKALHHLVDMSENNDKSVWKHILEALEILERDIPLALLYSTEENVKTKSCTLRLEGALGITKDHPAAPELCNLNEDNPYGFLPAMRLAKSCGAPVFYKSEEQPLPESLRHNVDWRGYGEPSKTILVVPLTSSGKTVAFLVVGTNPRRAYHVEFKNFIQEFARLASAAVDCSTSFEQALSRQAKLNKELTEMERFVRQIADISPSGLYSLSQEGLIPWANAKFYEITGISNKEEEKYKMSFMDCIFEEDLEHAYNSWREASTLNKPISCEVRVKRKWQPPAGADGEPSPEEPAWVLANALPTLENGVAGNIIGCLVDISDIKWAQRVQAEAAENAREAKRSQERFIDVTSHEMRNPLSAIMQCADGIVASIRDAEVVPLREDSAVQALRSIADAAQTIMLCAFHQKRIVDDILTVSKLDSNMLSISPTLVHPVTVASEALQMFESEFSAFDISKQFVVDPSLHQLGADLVHCDPMRLSQIWINLLTNAIKFTKHSSIRHIRVSIGAAMSAPPSGVSGAPQWFPSKHACSTKPVEGDEDSHIYIMFSIQDSGRGITDEEITKLFNRFAQANAKTHIHYGGSGLGLFISRELTELMGGMIGASSTIGKGSTFAFYIRATKPTPAEVVKQQVSRPTALMGQLSLQAEAKVTQVRSATASSLNVLLVEGTLVSKSMSEFSSTRTDKKSNRQSNQSKSPQQSS